MTKETKQDVFEEVVKDCEEFGIYFSEENQVGRVDGRTVDQVSKDYRNRYAAASPCKLPVIPQIIADYIKQEYADNYDLGHAFWMAYESSEEIGHVATWIIKHSNEFATAWLLGDWEVEDEHA